MSKGEIFLGYCAFHKHTNSKVQKPPSQLRFPLPSIIITITSRATNLETQKHTNTDLEEEEPLMKIVALVATDIW